MKKTAHLFLSSALLFSLAACSDKKEEPIIPRTTTIPQQQPAQPEQPPKFPPSHPPTEKGAALMGGSPHGVADKSGKKIVVPDAVKKNWSKVRLLLIDKSSGSKKDIIAPLGNELNIDGTSLKVKVGEFLPEFTMASGEITSRSNEPKQPAVRIEIYEQGRLLHKGWIFANLPDVHAFEHPKYSLLLKEGLR